MKKYLFLVVNFVWIIALGVIIAFGVQFYNDKNIEINNLKTSLETSSLELERLESKSEDLISKSEDLLKEKKSLEAKVAKIKDNIIDIQKAKTSLDEAVDALTFENNSLKNKMKTVNASIEEKVGAEKRRFEKELRLSKERYETKVKDISNKIDDLEKRLSSLNKKKQALGKIIKGATADVGRERLKFHHFQIALSYEYNERYKEAVKEYEKVLKLDPNNTETYLQLASIYTYRLDDLDKAEFYAKEYAKLKHMELSLVDNKEEDIEGDDTDLPIQFLKEKLADISFKNTSLEHRMLSMKESFKEKQILINNLKKVAERKDVIEGHLGLVAEKLKKEKLKFHYNLAFMYDKAADYENASKEYLEVLKISPDDADTHYNLAILYDDHLENKKGAIKHYKSYLKLRPSSEDAERVEYWLARATRAANTKDNIFGIKADVLKRKKDIVKK